MQFSSYQTAVFDFVSKGSGNGLINAVAGSGKTTTIVEALKYIPSTQKTIFLAFNKSIVEELTSRVPNTVRVSTLHSFGFSAIRFKYGRDRKIEVDGNKVYNHIKLHSMQWEEMRDMKRDEESRYVANIKRLVSLVKMNLLKTVEEVCNIADYHNIDIDHMECQRALEIVESTKKTPWIVDFDDMIYLPASDSDFRLLKYDFVFIDECQDLNKAQQTLVRKITKPVTGRFVAVGDPSQAIYGFAGADANSYEKLRSIPNTTELPLSVSYRCGKNIIEKAQEIVPQIEAFEGAIDGEVRPGQINEVQDGDMILCRNKAPLIEATLAYLARGIKAYMMGRGDIGQMLINFVEKMKADTNAELFQKMRTHLDKYVERKVATTDMVREQVMNTVGYDYQVDKIECVKAIASAADVNTPQDIVNKVNHIFDESRSGICLSTIHKAKGLEADNVFALKSELLPSKYAKQEWQKTQERNLEYVMITRAKKQLVYLTDSKVSDRAQEEEETLMLD